MLSLEENAFDIQIGLESVVPLNALETSETPASLEFARELLMHYLRPVDSEMISTNLALGRVLSDDISAPLNIPPFNRSPLEGYALRAVDTKDAAPHNPFYFEVTQEIQAGSSSQNEVETREAVRIMTGAPLPPGADVIIKIEDVNVVGSSIEITKALSPFENVCFAGEDIEQGEQALFGGEYLGPAGIGVLAALGICNVQVYRKPVIAVIGNGDELADLQDKLSPGKIYDSNSTALASYIQQLGAQPLLAGIAADDTEVIARKIATSLEVADMVITTGGVSVGDYDLVRSALCSIGANILFHRIDMRPGTPALGAEKDGKLIICLSGNKAAAFVTFQLLARPSITALMGLKAPLLPITTAVLSEHYRKSSSQRNILRGQLFHEDCLLKVRLTGKQNPGIISSTLNCDALIDVSAHSGPLAAGIRVKVFLL